MERPLKHRATWELRGVVKALNMLTLLNTPEDWERLAQARQELRLRAKEKQAHKATVYA
jgi:hypothetical protein